jgi:two-component system phosphate regulon sensor histidine kinase PhoR
VLDLKELASAIGERAVLPTVGHELRTPLTSIRGYLETLLDGQVDPETARRFLETARREAVHLGRLIDAMLEISLLDLAPAPPSPWCDVVEQIRTTVEMVAPLARRGNVTIRTQAPKHAVARVDGDACVHALANLVENAMKHGSREGMVSIACRRSKRFVCVAVDDDGGGVPPAQRRRIFALGARGSAADRSGRGIGLAVVKTIAERSGGDVRVDESPLGGARFVLRFPAG